MKARKTGSSRTEYRKALKDMLPPKPTKKRITFVVLTTDTCKSLRTLMRGWSTFDGAGRRTPAQSVKVEDVGER